MGSDFREIVHDRLVKKAAGDLRGPRGGHYVAVGEPYDFRDDPDPRMVGYRMFTVRVRCRYVRPKREVGR